MLCENNVEKMSFFFIKIFEEAYVIACYRFSIKNYHNFDRSAKICNINMSVVYGDLYKIYRGSWHICGRAEECFWIIMAAK